MKFYKSITVFLVALLLSGNLNAQTGRAARYQPGDWVNYANFHFITSFEEGRDYVYIGTTHGVLRFNQLSNQWDIPYTLSNGLYNDYVLNMVWVNENRELWVITRGGIDIIYGGTDRWRHISQTNTYFQQFSQSIQVGQSSEFVFVNTGSRVLAINKFSNSIEQPSRAQVDQIRWKDLRFNANDLPLYSLQNPEWFINRAGGSLEDQDYRQFPFTVSFKDSRNSEYLGTWGAGFIKADATTLIGQVHRFGPVSTPVGAVYQDADNIWFGSASDRYQGPTEILGFPGISKWNFRTNDWYHITPQEETRIQNATIYTIQSDGSGGWLGTNRGLLHYNQQKNRWNSINDRQLGVVQINDMVVDDSTLWTATRTGVYEIANPAGNVRKKLSLLDKEIFAVYDLTKLGEHLYMATDYGLARYNTSTAEIEYYNEQGTTVSADEFDFVRVFLLTSSGDKLYYTTNYGMYELQPETGQMEQIPNIGLNATSQIRVLKGEPERVWVGFDDGAGELFTDRYEWEFYTTEDGLAANTVYDIFVDDEFVWFATRAGVTRFRKPQY